MDHEHCMMTVEKLIRKNSGASVQGNIKFPYDLFNIIDHVVPMVGSYLGALPNKSYTLLFFPKMFNFLFDKVYKFLQVLGKHLSECKGSLRGIHFV